MTLLNDFLSLNFYGSNGFGDDTARKVVNFLADLNYLQINYNKTRARSVLITHQFIFLVMSWVFNEELPDPKQKIDRVLKLVEAANEVENNTQC